MTKWKYDFDFSMLLGAREVRVKLQSNSSALSLQAPSGSGKSSLLRCMLKLNSKIEGKCSLAHQQIGYVPQDSLLIPTLNVTQNLLLSPRAEKELLPEISDALGIGHLLQRYPRMLSGGEKQRVSIGRALLSRPQLLILDEPFAALDLAMRQSIISFLKSWVEKNNIDLWLVTHDENSSTLMCQEHWTIEADTLKLMSAN